MVHLQNVTPKSPKEAQDICSPLLCNIYAEEIVRKGTFRRILKTQMQHLFLKKTTLFKLKTTDL